MWLKCCKKWDPSTELWCDKVYERYMKQRITLNWIIECIFDANSKATRDEEKAQFWSFQLPGGFQITGELVAVWRCCKFVGEDVSQHCTLSLEFAPFSRTDDNLKQMDVRDYLQSIVVLFFEWIKLWKELSEKTMTFEKQNL